MFFRKIPALILGLMIIGTMPFGKSLAEDNAYVFILAAHDNPYWNTVGEGIKDEAKIKGITPTIFEAQNGHDAEGELNICLTAIQKNPKIIVMGSLNSSVGIQCFKRATEKGIIVADFDATVSVADAEKAGIKLAFSIGSDNYSIGEKAAEYVKSICGKPAPKIFVLEGVPGSVPNEKRVGGFKAKIQQILPEASIIATISAEWDRLKAMNTTLDILQRQPDLDIIYAANDTMALGAAEAVRNLHRDTQIKIVGVDGTADGRKAVVEGHMAASVAQLPYLMGLHSIDLAMDAVASYKTGLSITTETPVLTKELIEGNKDPVLQYVR